MKQYRNSINKDHYGYFFLAPSILVFLFFGLYPLLNTFYLSLTDKVLMSSKVHFVGLHNFALLFSDQFFLRALGNTWIIWLLNFIPQIGFALLLAALFNDTRLKLKFTGLFRGIYYLPNILMPATVAVLFSTLFNFYGPVNQVLVHLGFYPEAQQFFLSVPFARGAASFILWWLWFGATLIIIMAGMTSISVSLYESAVIDGTSAWQAFRYITLPLLRPVLLYVLVTSLVGGMQLFDIPYLLTDGTGAPQGSLLTMNLLMCTKFSSSQGSIGEASSVGVMIFFITAIVAFGLFRLLGKERGSK